MLEINSFRFLMCTCDFSHFVITIMDSDETGFKGWSGEGVLLISGEENN